MEFMGDSYHSIGTEYEYENDVMKGRQEHIFLFLYSLLIHENVHFVSNIEIHFVQLLNFNIWFS